MSRRNQVLRNSHSEFERPGFVFRKEIASRGANLMLHCDDVPLPALAKRYGTPLYVYSATAVRQRLKAFEDAFRDVAHTICYSVKANSNLSILRLLAKSGCGFDVVSEGELERVRAAAPQTVSKIVFSGVGKSSGEINAALKAGILIFNVESESELSRLAECTEKLRKTARVALRVNPDVAADTHPYIATGLHKHKFGVPIASALALYARAAQAKYLKVAGVSVHIGSQITDVAPFEEAMIRLADLVRALRTQGQAIEYVDVGGGLGIDYRQARNDFAEYVGNYARAVTGPMRGLGIHLLLEPGRSILGPAGVLLTAVLYKKQNDGKRFVIVDAAMNDLIRPALYHAYHEIVAVVQTRNLSSQETVDVVGPVCESGDFFARDRELPQMEEGDLLAILDTGAYGMVLSSNYNSRPRAAEVLVSGKSVKVIRRREKVRDLYVAEL